MKPIPAVGISSALVQIIDFSINVLRKDNLIYEPTGTSTTPVEHSAVLQDIANNLYRLTDVIDQSELRKLQIEKTEKKGAKLSEAAQQLLKHSEQVKELARGSNDDAKWRTARDALTNGVWKKKDVTGTKKKLRALRREIDSSLLLALRQYLDHSAETGLPVFAKDTSGVALQHWEKWQNDALDSIHANDWRPNKKKNVEEFGKIVDTLITVENEAHFCDEVFSLLRFEEAAERLHSVEANMDGSMNWVFGDDRMGDEGGLLEWFGNTRGDNLFWITGKPGCGKTTLTKYLFRNPQIFDYLEAWSGTAPGITAAHFFWNSGTGLQKSAIGMLRSILYESLQDMIYGPLEQDRDIIPLLFPDRWSQFKSYGGGLHEFTLPELQKAFELMVADASKKFMFMVDGLDDMDEYSSEIVDMVISTTKKDNVKIIVSGYTRPELETAFESRPKLVLDEWTKKDSAAYIMNKFGDHETLEKLRRKSDNVEEMNAINTLAEKADGVFLWAKLATSLILHNVTEEDTFSAMRSRAGDLPNTLDLLIPKIVENMSPEDSEELYKVKALLESHHNACPGLLPLSFALTADTKSSLTADTRPLKTAESTKRVEDVRDILTNKCRSLITIFDVSSPEEPQTRGRPESLKVTYTHHVIRSILSSHPSPITTPPPPFDPIAHWSNANLWTLKTLRPSAHDSNIHIWPPLAACLSSALLLFRNTSKFPLKYLDTATTTALSHHAKSPATSDLPCYPSTTLASPLDLAVLLNIQPYVAIKAKTADKKEVRAAVEFSRAVRKRVGAGGGEDKWVGAEGREVLKEEWGKERAAVDALLEYYGKSVRFGGGAKMAIEIPECE
ncbi:hypothetical protein BDU57DRAFT_583573 [Ampelomyces quisqualis]|uniref:Nephrocystin 3-like N-terminal domain-containing protein n=1 Tax=Ampelomyces quisqualis TaxID=50730 RepID=A0A6A5QYY2_AMPQU|nr:hypothetical protein BDU57DRAFT_583573 [Ampelomyces quisqualis]